MKKPPLTVVGQDKRNQGAVLDGALMWASRGYAVFPCMPSKRPYVKDGFKAATTNPDQIRAWWAQYPDAIIGLPTGAGNGIVIVDLDVKPGVDGPDSWFHLEATHGRTDPPMVLTPSGGQHLWFRHPGEETLIKTSAGQIGLGIDIRGDGGYVIAPPSPGYDWEASVEDGPIPMPQWLIDLCRKAPAQDQLAAPQQPQASDFDLAGTIDAILSGSPLHDSLRGLTAHLKATGVADITAITLVRQLMMRSAAMTTRRAEWQQRYDDIPRLVYSAQRFVSEIDKVVNAEFELRPVTDMLKPTAISWTIKGLAPAASVGLVFGDPEAGKSLVLIDMACRVSTGTEYAGRRTAEGYVVYIAGEGHAGLPKRLKAWQDHNGIALTDRLRVSSIGAELLSIESVAQVIGAIQALPEPPKLVIIDTLAANFGPGDENSTQDMVSFVRGLQTIHQAAPDATVICAHHPGHGDKTRARGAAALKGALDFEYRLEHDGHGVRTMSCTKSKDFEPPKSLNFELEAVSLPWIDEDGDVVSAPVLTLTDKRPDKSSKPVSLTAQQKIGLDALKAALREHGTMPSAETLLNGEIAAGQQVVETGHWRDIFYKSMPGHRDNQKKAFQRVREALVAKGVIGFYQSNYWVMSK